MAHAANVGKEPVASGQSVAGRPRAFHADRSDERHQAIFTWSSGFEMVAPTRRVTLFNRLHPGSVGRYRRGTE
jgi:hypothetical protein